MYCFEMFSMKISLLALFLIPVLLHAQYYLPDLKIPGLKPTFYESLQSKTAIQTSPDFQMKGPVKTVCETVHSLKTNGADSSTCLKAEYLFSGKGKLVKYWEDSASTLHNSYEVINRVINTYDSSGVVLLETIRWTDSGQKSKTVIQFNKQGFREKEVYTCYDCEQGWNKKDPFYDSIFDYTLDYQWSPDFDSVSLKYQYVKQKSPYQRNQDRLYSFVGEINDKKKDSTKVRVEMIEGIGSRWNFVDEYEYDSQRRIVKWIIWDYEVKSSVNSHQMFEYKHNEKGELTEIKHSSTGRSPDYNQFVLNSQVEITYTSYDKYGNWVEREVKVTSSNYGMHDIRRNSSYCYKREFSYY
ncbi:MAG: hypothetical protein K0S23_2358 [Fluviicola sp.]|nr:hypothetical protein [Fluviicola sp.]